MREMEEILRAEVNRRTFLARVGTVGLGAVAVSALAGCGGSDGGSGVTNIYDSTNFPGIVGRNANEVVVNYAYTLEILEADLYRQALNLASGRALNTPLDPNPPSGLSSTGTYVKKPGIDGSLSPQLASIAFLYLAQYAYVEAAHRDYLSSVLDSLGAPKATPNAKGYTASFGNDLGSIMNLIYQVEETGARAYLGAAGYITDSNLLTVAAAIASTENRHSAGVAYVLGKPTGPIYLSGDYNVVNNSVSPNPSPDNDDTFQTYLKPPTVLNAVQPFFVK